MRTRIFSTMGALLLAGSSAFAQKPTKPVPPPGLPPTAVSFPAFAEHTLSNGAQVLVVENHEEPVVSVNVYIKGAGTTSDSDAKPGVAELTADLLNAGTKAMTSKQIAEKIEGMGANLNTGANLDWANVAITFLKSDADAVLDVLADVLVNPTFPADELETARKRTLTDLQVALSQPAQLAQREFEMVVFGKHPYGRQMTTTSVRSITREDLVNFHDMYYKPSNALIVVAGDVNPADITARLDKHLAAWTGKGPARPQFAAAPERTKREIILVNKPGAVQASYRIGQTIVPATNPDWAALTVARQILGGSSTAWLFSNLREKKGYTYGAYAQSTMRLDPGYWYMWGDVRNAVADSALTMFLDYANKLKSEPVPVADLEMAKSRLTGSFPLQIETPNQVASQVASAIMLGQGKDYVSTWRQKLAAVTAADIQRVANKYLHPEDALIVISGDASILKPKLEKFGPITVVDEEGKPIADAAASAPATQAAAFDASGIQPITLSYTVNANGMEMAQVTRTVAHDTLEGRDIIKTNTTTTGMMTGSASASFDAKTFAPISAKSDQQAGGREFSSFLTVNNGHVSGMVPAPPNGDPTPVDAALPAGAILADQGEFAIWLTNFDTTKELTLNTFSPGTGTIVPLTLKVTGESHQKVAAGEFDVYDIEMRGQQGSMKIYARKQAPHIVVKQEMQTQPVVIELKSIK